MGILSFLKKSEDYSNVDKIIIQYRGWEYQKEAAVFKVKDKDVDGYIIWQNKKATIQITFDAEKHSGSIYFLTGLYKTEKYVEIDHTIINFFKINSDNYPKLCGSDTATLLGNDSLDILHSEGFGSEMYDLIGIKLDEYDSYEGCGDTELDQFGFGSNNIEEIIIQDKAGETQNLDLNNLDSFIGFLENQFAGKKSKHELLFKLNMNYCESTEELSDRMDNHISFIKETLESEISEIELIYLDWDGSKSIQTSIVKNKMEEIDNLKAKTIDHCNTVLDGVCDSEYEIIFYLNNELLTKGYSALHNYIPHLISNFDQNINRVYLCHLPTGLSMLIEEDEIAGPLSIEFSDYLFQ
jgi:hypothetical protein